VTVVTTPTRFFSSRPTAAVAAAGPARLPTPLVAVLAALLALLAAPSLTSGVGALADQLMSGPPAVSAETPPGLSAASAEAPPGPDTAEGETRVRAYTAAGGTHVGAETGVDAGLHPAATGSYDQIVSGWLVAPRAPGLVDEAAAVGRSASTEWGRVVQNFQQHGDDWTRLSAHVEQATGRAYRGGTSIEEIFRRGDDWLVRHRIYGPGGDVLHETFRPYSKFGQ
jgi:hypothetical protein